jgi:sugar lactone lactonase YvrE
MTKLIEKNIEKPLLELQNELGESPLWDAEYQMLYWLDIESGQVQTYSPESKDYHVIDLETKAGCIAFTQKGQLLVATPNGLAFWNENEGLGPNQLEFFSAEDARKMNDGKVDSYGNFWVGSKGPKNASSLYRVTRGFRYQTMIDDVTISNGLDWSPNLHYFFFCDSGVNSVYRFNYTPLVGVLGGAELFLTTYEGTPDGLTVDAHGNIWVAIWDGWKVIGLTPEGEIFCEIHLPVSRPTSVAFGGPHMNELFITSARTGLSADSLNREPFAGSLFSIRLNTLGLLSNKFSD